MPGDPEPTKPFLLGLTMAGSVSAGAYLAGVVDFLTRALAAHAEAHPDRPVVLKVISGTSGGGTSASLVVASLLDGLPSERKLHAGTYAPRPQAARDYAFALRRLHDIWVTELALTVDPRAARRAKPDPDAAPEDDETPEGLLGVADLEACRRHRLPIPSLLSGFAIDRAANRALKDVVWRRGEGYPFLAEPLDLFITTTNVQGVVYQAHFDRRAGHKMSRHAMARHFAVHGLGTVPLGSAWLEGHHDRGVPLRTPPRGGAVDLGARRKGRAATAWTDLRETAMASGAFPVGLPSRFIHAKMGEHQAFEIDGAPSAAGGAWPLDLPLDELPRPDWGLAKTSPDGDATYVAVDGGVTNNEPFEFARYTLRPKAKGRGGKKGSDWLDPNPRGSAEADRAVIMIDAFPEGGVFATVSPENPLDLAGAGLPGVVGKLFGAMISQARFKPAELAAAAMPNVKSRFMIAPSRPAEGGSQALTGASLLACGALGGFSGFLDLRFRQHDFILGQRNCQRFLQEHFALDPANPIFGGDPGGPRTADGSERPVVELPPELAREIPQPDWPRMSFAELDALRGPMRSRLQGLYETQIASARPGFAMRAAGWALWNGLGRDRILAIALRSLEAALIEHGLLELELPESFHEPLPRGVVARLVSAADAGTTVAEIAEAFAQGRRSRGEAPLHPGAEADERAEIQRTLDHLREVRADHRCRVEAEKRDDGATAYRLKRFAPGGISGLVGRLFG
ncbi:hypothetical protein P2H44_13775 [Albimonas sp. CAU 1670]|uniref:hypothetical protein n=1 Tax=Albimonas sp. CAU 1670 TaxID=3032599 RepID=UPI0023DC1F0D|nr:hypothetical protein [Albimonas sp. CAU 1670]MDF2233624.1 hypothetical protein [Albimonas sp. CAU 1670]